MTASVTTRVKTDGTNEAHPAAPPNATLQITLSSVPAFSTAKPHSQLRFQNAAASATKNPTTTNASATRATMLAVYDHLQVPHNLAMADEPWRLDGLTSLAR
jgi:hypothetical protein